MNEHIMSEGQQLLIQQPRNEWGKTEGSASVRLKFQVNTTSAVLQLCGAATAEVWDSSREHR